jgi:hypothetical protein
MSATEEASVLKMVPEGFSWKFSVKEGSEAITDVVDRSWWLNKGEFILRGTTYRAHREGVMSGAFVLESASGVLARAEKPSAVRRSVVIEHSGRRYTLRARSALRHELLLLDDSRQIGFLSPEGTFTRRANVDLPQEWPLPVRIFVMWLASMLWNDH